VKLPSAIRVTVKSPSKLNVCVISTPDAIAASRAEIPDVAGGIDTDTGANDTVTPTADVSLTLGAGTVVTSPGIALGLITALATAPVAAVTTVPVVADT